MGFWFDVLGRMTFTVVTMFNVDVVRVESVGQFFGYMTFDQPNWIRFAFASKLKKYRTGFIPFVRTHKKSL